MKYTYYKYEHHKVYSDGAKDEWKVIYKVNHHTNEFAVIYNTQEGYMPDSEFCPIPWASGRLLDCIEDGATIDEEELFLMFL
jgi:hypothetical protein